MSRRASGLVAQPTTQPTTQPVMRPAMRQAAQSAAPRVRVAILAPEHALGWTIMGPADMLNSVGKVWPVLQGEAEVAAAFEVATVGRSREPVVCFQGMRLVPEMLLDDPAYLPDVILVPALFEESVRFGRSGWSLPWRPFVDWIRRHHARGAVVGAISTGVALLAETGLLDGRRAATHWAMLQSMAGHYRRVHFVPDASLQIAAPGSRLVTTAAGTAWQSLVLLLVARYCGSQRAIELARLFSTGRPDGGERLPGPGFIAPRDHGDAAILRAQRELSRSFDRADALAVARGQAGLSRRTFERRFRTATGHSPLVYLQELRMQQARQLLDGTMHGIDEIAVRVGYSDVAHFRQLFSRKSGLTPSHYRESFGMAGMFEGVREIM